MSPVPGMRMAAEDVARRRARVLQLSALGLSAREVAREMNLSPRTVQRYRDNERAGRPIGKREVGSWKLSRSGAGR